GTVSSITLALFACLVLTGFATHSVIKFRPYMSVPLLSYKCVHSILGVSLLLSYATMIVSEHCREKGRHWLAVAAPLLVWCVIIWAGLERMAYHNFMSQEVGLGRFPDSVERIKSFWTFED
ncbi:MAG: hypothetical protein AB7K24_13845, partial [Gemmataceae bacterium]